jgi:hypothetical protein
MNWVNLGVVKLAAFAIERPGAPRSGNWGRLGTDGKDKGCRRMFLRISLA